MGSSRVTMSIGCKNGTLFKQRGTNNLLFTFRSMLQKLTHKLGKGEDMGNFTLNVNLPLGKEYPVGRAGKLATGVFPQPTSQRAGSHRHSIAGRHTRPAGKSPNPKRDESSIPGDDPNLCR